MVNNPQPVFVVGTARSGTSYLHSLLNQHPLIRLSYESKLPLEGWQCYRNRSDLDSFPGFNRLLDDFIAIESGEDQNKWLVRAIDRNRKFLFDRHCSHSSFAGLVRDIFELDGPILCFGNKMLRAEMCPQILSIWPNARFIVLMRDPRAIVSSQLKRFKGRRLAYAAIYCDIHFKWSFAHAVNRKNFLILSYEHFICHPHPELKKILTFCGMQDPFYARQMLAKKPARSHAMDKWRERLTQNQIRQIESYCFHTMQTAGYKPRLALHQKKISILEKCIEIGFEKKQALFYGPQKWKQKNMIHRFLNWVRS
ncbi:MAG: sulfotransferase [Proteobacteria bacterium]|nr:sulfotransferase [Pseudomonadota bacterium]